MQGIADNIIANRTLSNYCVVVCKISCKEIMLMNIGAIDLFCGIGGLTYGLQSANIGVIAGIDLDISCKYAFEHNNHSKFIHKNIEDVTGKEIIELLEDYDIKVLAGCAPCQPFSNHQKNKYNRSKHKDWKLLYEFGRIVKESQPDIISMENVPALMKEKVFNDFVSLLEELKYNISHTIVNAADYGVAQNRRRLLLLANKKNKINLRSPTHRKCHTSVRTVIGYLPKVNAGEICLTDRIHLSPSLSEKNLKRIRSSKPNGTWHDWPESLLLDCHKKKSGKTYSSVYGRMSWDELSPTITTQFISYGTGRFGHPEQNRALTLREGALLQSFPKDYSFIAQDDKICMKTIARHIGNAVPPRLGEVIGLSIIDSVMENNKY